MIKLPTWVALVSKKLSVNYHLKKSAPIVISVLFMVTQSLGIFNRQLALDYTGVTLL